ncbi:VOC family protein [Formosa sp. PL04]|uniref:VOC family protein n=1 Tax=Formosa sp. PL04 TaxID=3081755 RepID=UPI002980C94F|nr:VOC family protein [Formosa sp. PL04]MDW5289245.1 VOC family protein [Formosa sp. PL04]
MANLNPYLTFLGNCEDAFNFYKTVFKTEFSFIVRFRDMPPQEGVKLSEADKNKIMHISIPINDSTTLMGSDAAGDWGQKTTVGNNITLSLNVDSKSEADSFFKALSNGGKVSMPMENTFWGDYFGMCTDKFNINWMVNFEQEPQP